MSFVDLGRGEIVAAEAMAYSLYAPVKGRLVMPYTGFLLTVPERSEPRISGSAARTLLFEEGKLRTQVGFPVVS